MLQNVTRMLSSNWPYRSNQLPGYFVFDFIGSGSSGYKNYFTDFSKEKVWETMHKSVI